MGCSISSHQRKTITRPAAPSFTVQPTNFVLENDHSFHDVYRLGKLLGTGSYGEVRLCVNRGNSIKRAVKIIRKDLLTSPKQRESLDKEVNILKSLDHPGIIRVFEYFEEVKRLYIVTEYCQGGELFDEIIKQKTLSEHHSALIMKQIFSVLEYLQTQEIVHRDIKPENILLEEKHNFLSLKIIDFGSAINCSKSTRLNSSNGTLYYMAPEVFDENYNYMCDLWSAGTILYVLLSGRLPFDGKSNEEVVQSIRDKNYCLDNETWGQVSEIAKDLIRNLLCSEQVRINSTKALSSEWMQKYSSPEVGISKLPDVLTNLEKFRAHHILKDAIKTYMTIQYISMADIKDLKEVFLLLDKDYDGKISYNELMAEYCKIVNEKEAKNVVQKILNEVDSDKNGYIDYSEFLRANVDIRKIVNEENLKNAFKMFDLDNSGKISSEELGRILDGENFNNNSLWEKIIKDFDINGDGEIDIEEFGMLLKNVSGAGNECLFK